MEKWWGWLPSLPFLSIPDQSGGNVLLIDRVSFLLLAAPSTLISMMTNASLDEDC
jgi:hypothetical protein